jgi:superfamily II DNA/RNA helicase
LSPRFTELGVDADLASVLEQRGISTAFAVQESAIPAALSGRDVCGRAPTGSGKTLAFGLPVAQLVRRAKPKQPAALILVPTRELAAQINTELAPLLALRKRRSAAVYGGMAFGPQLKAIRAGVDVIVACPGRLTDLVNRGDVRLDGVDIVVLDEADRMADMGFLPEVRRLLDQVRPDRQTLLFSATLDREIDVLVRSYQKDPFRCDVTPAHDDAAASSKVTHSFVSTSREKRIQLTADLVGTHGPTVVFCRTKHGADRVAAQLERAGVAAVAIHGDRTQKQRERALASFASRRVRALVATDVAARGIHVDDVGCVVHFDIPSDPKDYVHRSGRTGRAGADGVVVSFVTDQDRAKAAVIQKALGVTVDGPRGDAGRPVHQGGSRKPAPQRPAAIGGSKANRRWSATKAGARKRGGPAPSKFR